MSRKALIISSTACLLLGGLALLYFFNPVESKLFAPCPLFFATGLHCPGCGTLRGINRLLHGDMGAAFALNPLMVLMIPVLAAMLIWPKFIYQKWVPWTAFWIFIIFGIARNIPAWPFSVLAPH